MACQKGTPSLFLRDNGKETMRLTRQADVYTQKNESSKQLLGTLAE